ncbi:MAG TPA: TonB-dependent receptor, partial [Lacunisphaera sp.]|nr:TonB-dependent receptor [Lacunisphaera sp.]
MNARSARNLLALLALVAGAGAGHLAVAQTTPAAPADDETMKLDKMVVTGSYIPAALDEQRAMPIQVIDAKTMEVTGIKTNVLDLLRKTVPQIQGANNIGIENANISGGSTNGGSAVALRNIDTLVLVDGKRVAASAVAAGGASGGATEFVDLNLIPLSAVDRIEVLTDGASAIYGTDAVSGVINIILKKDYTGAEMGFHYTMAPNDTGGYWRQRSVSAVAGAGDEKTHLMMSFEWSQNAPLWERDVAYDQTYYGTSSYPGIISKGSDFYTLKAGLNAPSNATPDSVANLVAAGIYSGPTADVTTGFNLSSKPTILSKVDKRIMTVSGTHKVTDNISMNADFIYATTETEYQLNPQPVTASSTTLIGYGVSPITDTGFTIRNRFIYGPNRIYNNKTNFYRGTAEMAGKVNDYFNWNAWLNYNYSYQVALGENQILNSALLSALQNGLIDLFARQQDPTKLAKANIFGTSEAIYKSELVTYNALANGKVWDLPAGEIRYAAGFEYRREALNANADYNSVIPPGQTTSLWNNGTSLSPFDNARNVKSEFAELKIPITSPSMNIPGLHLMSLDGAVRHESYSDGNSTTVPKVSLRYLPVNDEIAIRATYAKSFTAPTLYDLYGPSSSGFTTSLGGLNAYNSSGSATGSKFANLQGFQLNGFNPALKPSNAKSYTAGIVYSPKAVKGLEVSVDYYNIKQTDLIGSPGGTTTMVQSVEALGPASPFAEYVTLGGFAGQGGTKVTGPGQASTNITNLYVIQGLVNIASQEQHGFDINLKYTLPVKEYGHITINTEWALLQKFFLKSGPTDSGTDYAGYDDYGTLPKYRSYTTIDWNYEGYGATLGITNLASVDNLSGDHIGSYTTLDLQGRYDLGKLNPMLKGASLGIGINNITDKQPNLDRTNYSSPPFDGSAYSFFGRIYFMDLKVKF